MSIRHLLVAASVLAGAGAFATPTITIDSVRQRYPWNNKVDITYTITEGQTADTFYELVFNARIGDVTYRLAQKNFGAPVATGTHTVYWVPPAGLKAADCTMYAALHPASAPGGNEYLVVDLASGDWAFEGMVSQEAANTKYNTDAYKTTKMAFRRVPAGAYPVQDGAATAYMASDFYIALFETSARQHHLMAGTAQGSASDTSPAVNQTWNGIRSSAAPGDPVPSAGTGPIAGLNAMTGLYFDLPTEAMWEVASRAGCSAEYCRFFGTTSPSATTDLLLYAVYNRPSYSYLAVGSKSPNQWGLYDVYGNVYEWCLDACEQDAGQSAPAANDGAGMSFTQSPATEGTGRIARGGSWNETSATWVRSAARDRRGNAETSSNKRGYRLAIVDSGAFPYVVTYPATTAITVADAAFSIDTRTTATDVSTQADLDSLLPISFGGAGDAGTVTVTDPSGTTETLDAETASSWRPTSAGTWTFTLSGSMEAASVAFTVAEGLEYEPVATLSGTVSIAEWSPVAGRPGWWRLSFTAPASQLSGSASRIVPDESFSVRSAATLSALMEEASGDGDYAAFEVYSAGTAVEGSTLRVTITVKGLEGSTGFLRICDPR